MKIKSEKTRTVLLLAGLLALFIGGVLVPYGLRDAGLQQRLEKAMSEMGIDGVDNDGLVRLYDEVYLRRARLDKRGQYVPDEDQIMLVIRDFSGLINSPGVSGQEIITEDAKLYADYNILPVKIQFNAPFATAYDLVGRIEKLSSVVRIDRLDVEAQADYPRQPLTVNLELSAFFAADAIGGGK